MLQDRSCGLFLASWIYPERIPVRLRNGFECPKPPKINFASIFHGFGLHFRRFSKDFSSNFARPACDESTNRNLKKESRDPHRASWLLRGAVASYCSHAFRNDFRTLHVQPFFIAYLQVHLVILCTAKMLCPAMFGIRWGSIRAPFGPISDQNFRSQKY